MDKKRLGQHRALSKEIIRLQKQLDKLYDRNLDIPEVMGKVKGSMHDFPYTEVRTTVLMQEPKQADEIGKLIRIKDKLLQDDKKGLLEIEQYISEIDDPEVRQIFEMTFYEGKKQKEVAMLMGLERSSISKKISSYLKVSHNSHK